MDSSQKQSGRYCLLLLKARYIKYHLQQIQCRAKTIESLEARLSEHGRIDAQNIEEIRNDLAGCRIIFYYNDDVNAFLSSGLVRDNFQVHWEKSHSIGFRGRPMGFRCGEPLTP